MLYIKLIKHNKTIKLNVPRKFFSIKRGLDDLSYDNYIFIFDFKKELEYH
jgi:hypothetical protein